MGDSSGLTRVGKGRDRGGERRVSQMSREEERRRKMRRKRGKRISKKEDFEYEEE